jgi:hypothetical protein
MLQGGLKVDSTHPALNLSQHKFDQLIGLSRICRRLPLQQLLELRQFMCTCKVLVNGLFGSLSCNMLFAEVAALLWVVRMNSN